MDITKKQFKCRTVGAKQYLWTPALHELFEKHGALNKYDCGNTKVLVSYFCPYANWTWYITEVSYTTEDDIMMFGLCCGLDNELGSVSLKQLHGIKGPTGLPAKYQMGIERDIHFSTQELAELRAEKGL